MTDSSDFRHAFMVFRSVPYPAYPQLLELQDWNSLLLTIDGHIAGYASKVHDGRMRAQDVPNLDQLILEVSSLGSSLDQIEPVTDEDRQSISDYRSYVAALGRMVSELGGLADQERRSTD